MAICCVLVAVAVMATTADDANACYRDYDGRRNSVVIPEGCPGYEAQQARQATSSAAGASDGTVLGAIRATFPARLVPAFEAIARCESNLDPDARNPVSHAFGPFQFLPSTEAGADGTNYAALDDPDYAAKEAYELYLEAGFSPWVCA